MDRDRVRQVGVTAAEVFCVLGTLVGVGVLGTRVEESSGGALAADATLIAPAGPAFSIWSVIYVGLAGYTLWQWLPGVTRDERARATGGLVAISMVLNAAWLLVTQQGWLWASVAVIVALLAVLLALAIRLVRLPARNDLVSKLVLDATAGLYLGWVAVATCANITATLVASGVRPGPGPAVAAAVVVLVVAALAGVAMAGLLAPVALLRGAVAAAMAWGLGWIAVGRTADEPVSMVTALVAVLAAVAVVVGAVRPRPAAAVLPRSPGTPHPVR